jgi:uncharacterized protein (DUF58 family)
MWFKKYKNDSPAKDVSLSLSELGTSGIDIALDELLKYQDKTALMGLAARKQLHGKLSGNYLARSKGRGMEFDEVRHYQHGDDIRAIDWRVTARTGKTHTKLFREEIERPVLLATDLSATMQFGSQLLFKSVQAAHLAALVAWHAQKRGDRLGGLIFNEYIHHELKPRSRQQGVLHYLHALVATKEQPGQGEDNFFEKSCARLRHLARPGSLVYLISDFHQLSDEACRHLTQISQHCELVACQIFDPLELNLPQSQEQLNLAVSDGRQRQQITLGNQKIASDYQRQAQIINEMKAQALEKAGARHLLINAGVPLAQQLKSGVA